MHNFLDVMLLTGADVISTLPRSHNSTQEHIGSNCPCSSEMHKRKCYLAKT